MPEFLNLLSPDEARKLLLDGLSGTSGAESINAALAFGRVCAEDVFATQPLPDFVRSTVDGYAVHARDTYGASESLPGYLLVRAEVPMGAAPDFAIRSGECALIHTGGMLPDGADAVVMLEYTQEVRSGEIEIQKAVASAENVIRIGEDVAKGQLVIPRGTRMRPVEIGGLMALGITRLQVARKPRVALISSGDEVRDPGDHNILPGQVRDINAHTLASLVVRSGGEPIFYGIIPDDFMALQEVAARAKSECDVVVITAGSSASTRDMTADVINMLGKPGVLVHGINTKPGKPTILGICAGKPVIGLPGNPVSALINGYLFLIPVIGKLMGLAFTLPKPTVRARLTINLASQAGREDWQPVKLVESPDGWLAEPVFGKSNLIFTLASASGLIRIHPDANGISAGEIVDVILID